MKDFRWRTLGWWSKTCVVTAGFVILLAFAAATILTLTSPQTEGSLPAFTVPLTHALFPLFVVVVLSAFTRVQSALNVRRSGLTPPSRT